VVYVWLYSCKNELNKKFECKNQFLNQKLRFLASSRINSGSIIDSTFKKSTSQNQLYVSKINSGGYKIETKSQLLGIDLIEKLQYFKPLWKIHSAQHNIVVIVVCVNYKCLSLCYCCNTIFIRF
jgi:hypothetical protein